MTARILCAIGGILLANGVLMADSTTDPSFLRLFAETRGFMSGRPVKPKITPDGKTVIFLRGEAKSNRLKLYEFNLASRKTTEILAPEDLLQGKTEDLTAEEKARRERMRQSVGGFSDFQLSEDGSSILLPFSGKLYLCDRTKRTVRVLATGAGAVIDPKWSRDGTKIAYVRGYDVYVLDLKTNTEQAITSGGTVRKTNGLAEFVAQEEMGRLSGFWWSPDSQSIAYEEADADGVETWHVADPLKPGTAPLEQFYPRPGKANVKVRLGIVPISGGATKWVEWDRNAFEYLAQVRWAKAALTILVQDRKQQHQQLLRVDPTTGKTFLLLEERDAAWLNLHDQVPRWLDEGKFFLWIGEQRDGAKLELRNADGKLIRNLHESGALFPDLIDVDEKANRVMFAATLRPTERRIVLTGIFQDRPGFRAELDSRLSPIRAVSTATASPDHHLAIVTSTSLSSMPITNIVSVDGSEPAIPLPSVALEPSFVPNMVMETGDGSLQHPYALIRPRTFEPGKKYPVIVDVYGGPRHLKVQNAMRPWLLMQWLADQGFIIVAIENRGTPVFGRTWERAVYQKFGNIPLDDQASQLQRIAQSHRELDLQRVGIVGWSFGGYMAAQAVLKRPDVFHAAVAGAPVTDWEDYDTHYTERYMGVLPESASAYRAGSLLPYASKLERPLLLIHGTADDNVYFRHSLRLSDALFRAGRDFDILPLPGLTHMVADPQVSEMMWQRIAKYFTKHLNSPSER